VEDLLVGLRDGTGRPLWSSPTTPGSRPGRTRGIFCPKGR
jgi:hypothetical protein